MKKQFITEAKRFQKLANILKEAQEIELFIQKSSLGSYTPEEGDLSEGFKDHCNIKGPLNNYNTGEIDCLVFEGNTYVCILTIESGYGNPSITVCDKSVLDEIKERTIKGQGYDFLKKD
jgi:hypothetical protein